MLFKSESVEYLIDKLVSPNEPIYIKSLTIHYICGIITISLFYTILNFTKNIGENS